MKLKAKSALSAMIVLCMVMSLVFPGQVRASTYQDGYKIVDKINVNTKELSLKYKKYKLVSFENDGKKEKAVILYFRFKNKSNHAQTFSSAIDVKLFQKGIEQIHWLGGFGNNEDDPTWNHNTEILKGASIDVGIVFGLKNFSSPVKIRVGNAMFSDNDVEFAQQQKLKIKK